MTKKSGRRARRRHRQDAAPSPDNKWQRTQRHERRLQKEHIKRLEHPQLE